MTSNDKEMSVWGHIGELRGRLLKMVVALALTTIASFMFAQNLIDFLAVPNGGLVNLTSIEVTENVGVFMRVSMLSGFILAFPIIFYQFVAFIMPGLLPSERKVIYLFVPFATLLFLGGVAFSYYVMMPNAIKFLTQGIIPNLKTTPRIENYINFVTNLMFWTGISFETPLIMFLLAKFRVISSKLLITQWKFAVVIIALVAAVVTPTPDPINMGLLMAPLFGLYILSIALAKIARPKD
jgi:sec-independent protein translocase protein TatC